MRRTRSVGFFAKNNVDGQMVFIPGSPTLIASLNTGDVHFGFTGGTATLGAAVAGLDVKVIAAFADRVQSELGTRPEIKSAADLKGKGVAISSFGSVSHAATLASLAQLGLKASDVTRQVLGGESSRTAAVVSGAVAAAPVSAVNTPKLVAQGLNILVDLTKTPIKFAIAGMTLTKAWAAKNPNTIRGGAKGRPPGCDRREEPRSTAATGPRSLHGALC